MGLTVIIFESALELIPESLRSHPTIRKEWKVNTRKKKRGVILDRAIHNPLMESLNDHHKRGRPDIVHSILLNLIYSPLVKNETLRIIIHTYDNHCIHIPSNWRIPVNYNRFNGLMAQLLYNKKIPVEGDPILTVKQCSIQKLLQKYFDHQIFLLESVPESSSVVNNLNGIFTDESVFLIGGFQSGSHNLNFEDLKLENFRILSLYREVIPAWMAASKLLHMLEEQLV